MHLGKILLRDSQNERIRVGFRHVRVHIKGVLGPRQIVGSSRRVHAQRRDRLTHSVRMRIDVVHRSVEFAHDEQSDASLRPRQFPGVDQSVNGGQRLKHCRNSGSVVLSSLFR